MKNLLALSAGTLTALIIVAVVVVLVLIIVCWAISARNSFVRSKNVCEEALAGIDVYLKKRYDLIPNLVETVKGYAKHESETLEKVIAARNNAGKASSTAEKIEADAALTKSLKSINVVAEQYPDLKANANFIDLSAQLKGIESELATARKYYNGTVKSFNTEIEIFPKSIIASSMHLEKFPYFKLDSDEERQNVKVQF